MKRFIIWACHMCLLLSFKSVYAHEGEPNMAFSWLNDKIVVDVRRQSFAFGDLKAFVIPFTGTLTPFRMGDAGFTGFGFDQGGFIGYQHESTLLKWSKQASQWQSMGFKEQVVLSRLGAETIASDINGKMQQGLIANLSATSQFEAHPVFEIETLDGSLPDDGAYLLYLSVLGVDATGDNLIYGPSDPFALVFHSNAQRSFDESQLTAALSVVPDIELNDYPRMDALFDWAESEFSDLFPHAVASQLLFGYYARCYDNGVCVGSKDGKIYTVGGVLGVLTEQGPLQVFYDLAGL